MKSGVIRREEEKINRSNKEMLKITEMKTMVEEDKYEWMEINSK